jgi:hypothetical protein
MMHDVISHRMNQEIRVSESGNVTIIARFLEEVINQGRLEQADELVAVDFVELGVIPKA